MGKRRKAPLLYSGITKAASRVPIGFLCTSIICLSYITSLPIFRPARRLILCACPASWLTSSAKLKPSSTSTDEHITNCPLWRLYLIQKATPNITTAPLNPRCARHRPIALSYTATPNSSSNVATSAHNSYGNKYLTGQSAFPSIGHVLSAGKLVPVTSTERQPRIWQFNHMQRPASEILT